METRQERLRWLLAFDALLVEGSVGKAGERLGIGTPAMSRLLKQLREHYDDPIVVRTAHGMVPTPFAEALRLRLRAVAAESDDLMSVRPSALKSSASRAPKPECNRPATIIEAPPLAISTGPQLERAPQPADIARKLAAIGRDAGPQRRLAKFIATVGAGVGRTRPLTLDEADEAFSAVLAGEANPIQIGALLVVLQYRSPTAPELAGLVQASRRQLGASPIGSTAVDLDWPAHISPKSRTAPWFLLSAMLLAQAGKKLLIHGNANGAPSGERLELAACAYLGIPVCQSLEAARAALLHGNIAYLPLCSMSPALHELSRLYSYFEMRSPVQLLVHLLNPLGARTSLLGAASSSYRDIHRDAATLLGWQSMGILGNNRDVAECTPARSTEIFRLVRGEKADMLLPAQYRAPKSLPPVMSAIDYWRLVWQGREKDDLARRTVIDTAAMALLSLQQAEADAWPAAREQAEDLWHARAYGSERSAPAGLVSL